MNFKQWLTKYSESLDGTVSLETLAKDSWGACKREIIKILQNTDVPKEAGIEGLGGCQWDDMSADKFRDLLVEKIKKL